MSKIFLRVLAGVLIIALGVTIWGIFKNVTEKSSIEDKIVVEIAYLDESLTDIINYLNNITINMYNVSESSSGQQQSQSGQSGNGASGGSSGGSESGSSGGGQSQGDSGDSGQGSSGDSGQGGSGGGSSQSQGSNQNASSNNTETTLVQYQIEKNNILNSNRETNWEQIKNNVETLYSSLTTIKLDLQELGIEDSKIVKFSDLLDDTIISIKEENKEESVQKLSEVYKYVSEFYPKYDEKKYVYQTKAEIIEAYSLIETGEWEQISDKISLAQEKFVKVSEKSDKIITVDKVNLLLKELKEGVKLEDNDVFYIKYKNLLDEMNNLC